MNPLAATAVRPRYNLVNTQKGTKTMHARMKLLVGAIGAVAALTVSGCTVVQDTFQVGEREFHFDTIADVQESGEAFRFQGFLPDDATDIRLIAQLDGHASLMRWTSPTEFDSEHCRVVDVTTPPPFDPEWLIDPIPEAGAACGSWTVVSSGGVHFAWSDPEGE